MHWCVSVANPVDVRPECACILEILIKIVRQHIPADASHAVKFKKRIEKVEKNWINDEIYLVR